MNSEVLSHEKSQRFYRKCQKKAGKYWQQSANKMIALHMPGKAIQLVEIDPRLPGTLGNNSSTKIYIMRTSETRLYGTGQQAGFGPNEVYSVFVSSWPPSSLRKYVALFTAKWLANKYLSFSRDNPWFGFLFLTFNWPCKQGSHNVDSTLSLWSEPFFHGKRYTFINRTINCHVMVPNGMLSISVNYSKRCCQIPVRWFPVPFLRTIVSRFFLSWPVVGYRHSQTIRLIRLRLHAQTLLLPVTSSKTIFNPLYCVCSLCCSTIHVVSTTLLLQSTHTNPSTPFTISFSLICWPLFFLRSLPVLW